MNAQTSFQNCWQNQLENRGDVRLIKGHFSTAG